jgi:hypothetical protein
MKSILQAVEDPRLFAPWFKDSTWAAWRAWLAALFGLPMTPDQLALFTQCTGRSVAPTGPAREGWLVCGRRAGKSFILALIAVYFATFRDYARYLAPGERGTLLILAADRKQSRVIFRYISALLKQVPMLARMIENERAESFDLTNRVTIEVAPPAIAPPAATRSSRFCVTSWRSGVLTTVPVPTTKSSMRSGRAC